MNFFIVQSFLRRSGCAVMLTALALILTGCQNANEASADLDGAPPVDPSGKTTEVPATDEGYQQYQDQSTQQQREAYSQEGYPGGPPR